MRICYCSFPWYIDIWNSRILPMFFSVFSSSLSESPLYYEFSTFEILVFWRVPVCFQFTVSWFFLTFICLQGPWNYSCRDASYCNLQSIPPPGNVSTPCDCYWRGKNLFFTVNILVSFCSNWLLLIAQILLGMSLHIPNIYLNCDSFFLCFFILFLFFIFGKWSWTLWFLIELSYESFFFFSTKKIF